MKEKKKLDILVISDTHLGTLGSHAKQLYQYLSSVEPEVLILNGDIIDIWNFNKFFWPKSHMLVVKKIIDIIASGTTVYYLTGNHDELLRKFTGLSIGNFHLKNKLVMEVDGKSMWFFHGDVFDVTMKHSKWLAKLGSVGYDLLILINRSVNFILKHVFRRDKISLSKRIKDSVKSAVKFVDNFEQTAIDLAHSERYDYVACGHIHKACIKDYPKEGHTVTYLNSGDWVENLTALEYVNGEWELYQHNEKEFEPISKEEIESNLTVEFDKIMEKEALDGVKNKAEQILISTLVQASIKSSASTPQNGKLIADQKK